MSGSSSSQKRAVRPGRGTRCATLSELQSAEERVKQLKSLEEKKERKQARDEAKGRGVELLPAAVTVALETDQSLKARKEREKPALVDERKKLLEVHASGNTGASVPALVESDAEEPESPKVKRKLALKTPKGSNKKRRTVSVSENSAASERSDMDESEESTPELLSEGDDSSSSSGSSSSEANFDTDDSGSNWSAGGEEEEEEDRRGKKRRGVRTKSRAGTNKKNRTAALFAKFCAAQEKVKKEKKEKKERRSTGKKERQRRTDKPKKRRQNSDSGGADSTGANQRGCPAIPPTSQSITVTTPSPIAFDCDISSSVVEITAKVMHIIVFIYSIMAVLHAFLYC
jgi:hypothetical protein